MANLSWRSGLRPIANGVAGTVPLVEHWRCEGTQIGKNAVVAVTAAGRVTMAGASSSVVLGVALNFVAAGTAGIASRVAVVNVDPNQRFIAQVNNGTLQNLAAYRETFTALVSNATVNATTGESKGELDGAGTTSVWAAAKQIRIIDIYSSPDNVVDGTTAGSSNADFIVMFPRQTHVRAGNKAV